MIDVEALIAFSAVMDAGSFSGAAARLGQTPSGVSRTIARLEKHLGLTLLHRTTRRLQLTDEGAWFLERARTLLADLANTEAEAAARRSQPSGLVRVNAATPALDHLLAPLVPAFLDAYPLVQLELTSGETVIDLIEERADLAIRIGNLPDSTLNARRLGASRVRVLAAPAYLERHGMPANVAELARHRLLGFSQPASLNTWPLAHEGAEGYTIAPSVSASSGETVRHLALEGQGIACLSHFMTIDDIRAGRLKVLLGEFNSGYRQPINAVYYRNSQLALRIQCFLDFIQSKLAAYASADFKG